MSYLETLCWHEHAIIIRILSKFSFSLLLVSGKLYNYAKVKI